MALYWHHFTTSLMNVSFYMHANVSAKQIIRNRTVGWLYIYIYIYTYIPTHYFNKSIVVSGCAILSLLSFISQILWGRHVAYLTCSVSWNFSFSFVENSISWFWLVCLKSRLNLPCRLRKFISFSSVINRILMLYSDSIISLKFCPSFFIIDTEMTDFRLNTTDNYLWSLSIYNSNTNPRKYKVLGRK